MNIEAFKELINIYSDFTLEELEEFWIEDGKTTMHELTGFSSFRCILCKAADRNCENCLYSITRPYEYKGHISCLGETYDGIEYAKTPQELYDAIQKRIEFMKSILEMYEQISN